MGRMLKRKDLAFTLYEAGLGVKGSCKLKKGEMNMPLTSFGGFEKEISLVKRLLEC